MDESQFNQIKFHARCGDSKGMIDVFHNGQPLRIDVPVMWVPWKATNRYGKCYIDISFLHIETCTYTSQLFCIIYQLENYIMNLPNVPNDYTFIRSLKGDPNHKHPPRMRVRVGPWFVQHRTFVSGTIRCLGVWCSPENRTFGCSWYFDNVVVLGDDPEQWTTFDNFITKQ